MAKQNKPGYPPPGRLRFPDDEGMFPWLRTLLDAYYIADVGVAEGIAREQRQGKRLACGRGCSDCCRTHDTIPVYPLEMMGVSWYATEKVGGDIRGALKSRLYNHREIDACPFLVESICAVHPLRPMACRHFNVFGEPCRPGEDAYFTRRGDVLIPLRRYMNQAWDTMLPFYGVKRKPERRKLINSGGMHALAKVMKECRWESLAAKMDKYDRSGGGG